MELSAFSKAFYGNHDTQHDKENSKKYKARGLGLSDDTGTKYSHE